MVKIKLINYEDVRDVERGIIPQGAIRTMEVDALADTGAMGLALPEEVVEALGFPIMGNRQLTVADGRGVVFPIAGMVRVELLGRDATGEAIVLPKGARALLGVVQLELLDLVVVPSTGEVIPNPEHPNGPEWPLYRLAG